MSIWFGYMAVPDGAVVADGPFEGVEAAKKARTHRKAVDIAVSPWFAASDKDEATQIAKWHLQAPHTLRMRRDDRNMKKANRIYRATLQCPYCERKFPITRENVTPAPSPKGSGGCTAFANCPHCDEQSCVEEDSLDLKPESTTTFDR